VARLLLPYCIIDFSFSPLIPIKCSFCDLELLCSEHKKSFSGDKASDIQRCGDAFDMAMKDDCVDQPSFYSHGEY
jgi:hypothetical protein